MILKYTHLRLFFSQISFLIYVDVCELALFVYNVHACPFGGHRRASVSLSHHEGAGSGLKSFARAVSSVNHRIIAPVSHL